MKQQSETLKSSGEGLKIKGAAGVFFELDYSPNGNKLEGKFRDAHKKETLIKNWKELDDFLPELRKHFDQKQIDEIERLKYMAAPKATKPSNR